MLDERSKSIVTRTPFIRLKKREKGVKLKDEIETAMAKNERQCGVKRNGVVVTGSNYDTLSCLFLAH